MVVVVIAQPAVIVAVQPVVVVVIVQPAVVAVARLSYGSGNNGSSSIRISSGAGDHDCRDSSG